MSTISLSLAGKLAVIIGGTSGIGRALSLGLAEAGADVIASARRKENVEEVAAEINAIAPGVFRTALNTDLLDNTPRGKELLMRTPMGRFGQTEELVGAAVYLASDEPHSSQDKFLL